MDKQIQLYLGDCKEVLKGIEDNSIDLILTDPPYGYSFMGKDWDKVVIPSSTWKECLRVLKPGAFAFIMSAPRQDVLGRMIYNLQEAGFETGFTSIYWAYASGFPKAINISKAIDKRKGLKGKEVGKAKGHTGEKVNNHLGVHDDDNYEWKGEYSITEPESEEAKQLKGSFGGFQPKPAVEIIIVVMKSLSEKGYIDQALKNNKGITNLDDCRIPTSDKVIANFNDFSEIHGNQFGSGKKITTISQTEKNSRFPANLLVSDDILNDGKERTSNKSKDDKSASGGIWQKSTGKPAGQTYNDSGSFSRYFDLDAWAKENNISEDYNTFPFLICPKASKSEKNKGCENLEEKDCQPAGLVGAINKGTEKPREKRSNFHPTVKPIKLMSYLITLGSKKGDIILDPFMGSGTTGVACKLLNRRFIGIELSEDYLKIAQERIKNTIIPKREEDRKTDKEEER